MSNIAVETVPVRKLKQGEPTETEDILAVEEPLEIKLAYSVNDVYTEKAISVTMRTPGNDSELAVGFLFTEGIIQSPADVESVASKPFDSNIVVVKLSSHVQPNMAGLERNFYTTSSCGVCGKTSIDAVKTVCKAYPSTTPISFSHSILYSLPTLLRQNQSVFDATGGLHASAIFDVTGKLISTREDVGRHNALDKLIGAALLNNMIPLDNYLLLLSGRASFELVQKASMAGIRMIAAVGAPSSLAVQLAKECNITLVGFLRDERFNIYSGAERITG